MTNIELEKECEELGRSMLTHGWTVMATMRALDRYIHEIQHDASKRTAFEEAQKCAEYEPRLVSLRHAARATEAVYSCIQTDTVAGYMVALRNRDVTEDELALLVEPAWALAEKGIPMDQAVICLLAELADIKAQAQGGDPVPPLGG